MTEPDTLTCARCGRITERGSLDCVSWGEGIGPDGLLVICGDCMTDHEKEQTALRTARQILEMAHGEDVRDHPDYPEWLR